MRCNMPGCYREASINDYCEKHQEAGHTLDAITAYYREKSEKIMNEKLQERLKKYKHNKLYNTAAWKKLKQELYLERGFFCEKCSSSNNLEVHHIYSSDNEELFFNKENLIILCSECHHKVTMEKVRSFRRG